MDPLSITASIAALVGVADLSVKGLKKLRSAHKAPAEIDAVVNEIEDFRLWIGYMNDTAPQSSLNSDVPALTKLLDEARGQLTKLNEVVTSNLKPHGKPSQFA
jgi:hypothetical protein